MLCQPPGIDAGLLSDANTALTSHHVGGAHVLMTDGAVRFIGENVDFTNLMRMASKDEGHVVSDF